MTTCLIYIITNDINRNVYIGQTWQSLKQRFWEHNRKVSGCWHLSAAIKKYGIKNFHINLLTVCHTQTVADYWENYFIEKFDSIQNGYNLKGGGSHGNHSESTKKKIAQSKIGKPRTQQEKDNMSLSAPRGEKRAGSKLNADKVVQIRAEYQSGATQHELARIYGVGCTTIYDIVNYRKWKHIP